MPAPPPSPPRWDPSWKRLAGGTVALFLVILAFLAGRVNAGEDPGLRKSATVVATPQATSTPDPYALPPAAGAGAPGPDPYAAPPSAPGTDPSFQAPGDDGSAQPAPAAPEDPNPPTTQQS